MNRVLCYSAIAACLVGSACAARRPTAAPPPATATEHTHVASNPSAEQPMPAAPGHGFTAADVRFMQDMIGHHAQAIVMAAMAPTHGAGDLVLKLAQKIDISQRDEIRMMKDWLTERKQPVPDEHHMHGMHMAGMLTAEQMAELDAARGRAFDLLFLRFMIQHHRGALQMVDVLVASPGAAQDSDLFRFVTDVVTDQSDEIDVMEHMLDLLSTQGSDNR